MTLLARLNAAFWTAAMSLFMAACSSDVLSEDMASRLGLSPSIEFVLSEQLSTTRGVPVNSLGDLKDFRADAYLHRGGTSILYFQNEKQYDLTTGGVFRSDNASLWPSEQGDKMTFVALSPWAVAENLTISEQGDFTYTVPDNVVDQCDLMLARATDVECPTITIAGAISERDPVPLSFHHLLTQVRFVFGANNANFWRGLTVHSVRVENISRTGTWSQTDRAWSITDPPTHSFEIVADTTGPGSGVRPNILYEKEIWESGYTMFLLPQTLPTGARVAVDMSHSVSSASHGERLERKTYYIYLDGKKLLPGHTVIVEINSNDTADYKVVNTDYSDVELRPLPAKGQSTPLRLFWNSAGGSLKMMIDPRCTDFATLSSDLSPTPGTRCDVNELFTIHTTDNTSSSDRFIRLIISEGHTGFGSDSYIVVLKQRGGVSSYGSFSDDLSYEDTMQPWGFNWTTPLSISFYSEPWLIQIDYQSIGGIIGAWSSMGTDNITLDYATLRNLVRTPNSSSDGLENTLAINSHVFFLKPSGAMIYLLAMLGVDTVRVNGEEIDIDQFKTTYPSFDCSAVMEIVGLNTSKGPYSGVAGAECVYNINIERYLPAIEQLETMAQDSNTSLERGRTYWSSTVDVDGEPLALTINSDGTFTRSKPGADTLAYIHPVKKIE